MRKFHSYGPVDREEHFCVKREKLVAQCRDQLVGNPEKGGHYFTIWAPRQTGKTWLMRRVVQEIKTLFPKRFIIGQMSCQGILLNPEAPEKDFLKRVPRIGL